MELNEETQIPNLYEQMQLDLTKNIIERWEELGLLMGVDGDSKKIIAYAFEELARKIISSSDIALTPTLTTLSFPIIRRILSKNDNYKKLSPLEIPLMILFVDKFIYDLNNVLKTNPDILDTTHSVTDLGTDLEAEFCAKFSEDYQLLDNYYRDWSIKIKTN